MALIKYLTVFLLSMVPVVELRGAIPTGIALGLSPILTYVAAVVGNFIPAPIIILLIRRIFTFLRKHFPFMERLISWVERKAHLKGHMIRKYDLIGLFLLVAIPIPGTGAWMGALAASVLEVRLKRAMPAIALGILVAGLIVLLISCGVKFVVT